MASQQQSSSRRIPNRDLAGSLTLPRPTTKKTATSAAVNANNEVLECGGNVLLMEARLCEITSSIRALVRSNDDLEEALRDSPNDPDFLQAVEENKIAIRRQGLVATSLVDGMKSKGANVDLEDDITRAISGVNVDIGVIADRAEPGSASGATSHGNGNANPQNNGEEQANSSAGLFL